MYKKSPASAGLQNIIKKLYTEVSKRFVGFSHTMRIFFLLESSAFSFASSNNFIG
jgi:hypothetical protein